MTGPSLLHAAVDELYSSPMAEFTSRRKALATAARKGGDRDAAAEIAALRKPTLSADTLNRLVRAAPDEIDELLELGADLRAAEKALDAATLRELSTKRRHLVNDLARLAFDITDQTSPSASVRDEVTSTLNAALADERIADMLLSGALVTQARWDGFGSTSLPELAAVLPMDPNRRRSATGATRPSAAGSGTGASAARRAVATPAKPSVARPAGRADAASSRTAATAAVAGDLRGHAEEPSVTPAEREKARLAAAETARKAAAETARKDAEEAERRAEQDEADRVHRRRLAVAQEAAQQAQEAAAEARQTVADIDRQISELSLQLAHAREMAVKAQKDLREAETLRRNTQLALTRAGGAVDLRDAPGRKK